MYYTPKHAAKRTRSIRSRIAGVAAVSGATVAAGMVTAPQSASAASGNVWDRVAQCESGGNWSIANGNGYYGGLQFSASTWRAYGGARYAATANRASRAQQIAIAQNVLRGQGPGAWPVCSRKAGLTRANGLAASGGSVSAVAASRGRKSVASTKGTYTRAQVRELQDWVGYRRSGVWDRRTTRGLQRMVGAKVTGTLNKSTVFRVERRIGAKQTGLTYFNRASMKRLMAYAASH